MILRGLSSAPHTIAHLEFLVIWSMLVLRTTNYWIHEEESHLLPEQWIYITQTLGYLLQNWLMFYGLASSLICLLVFRRRMNVWWSAMSGLLWIMMVFLPSPLEKMCIAVAHSLTSSAKIITTRLEKKKFSSTQHQRKIDSIVKTPGTPVKSTSTQHNVFRVPLNTSPALCDLDLSRLDIGTRGNQYGSPTLKNRTFSSCSSGGFSKPKPVISPSRFSPSVVSSPQSNLTKASWVAGGYWHQNKNWGSPSSTSFSPPSSPIGTIYASPTRSSSQSSGFGSTQTGIFNRSPPDSRPESTMEEFDQLSVYSDNLLEPRSFAECESAHTSFRYPESSPVPFNFPPNDVSRMSMLSSISSNVSPAGSPHPSPLPPTTSSPKQFSWLLPFLFGFSLAVNICVLTYCVILKS